MDHIPVQFELEGKTYKGTLDEVSGAGLDQWQLMVAGYYWGRLGDDLVNHFAELFIA